MLKKFFLSLIFFYQHYVSAFFGAKCRYYPSCSEYSKQLFEFQNPCIALFKTLMRILSCNQFFKGGIAYPKIDTKINAHFMPPKTPKYWLIPIKPLRFQPIILKHSMVYPTQNVYIIKNFSKVSRVK